MMTPGHSAPTRVWIRVEVAVLQQLAQGALDAHVNKVDHAQPGRVHGLSHGGL